MGFWNVKARDLKVGDEIRIASGELGFWKVGDVDTGGASGRIAAKVEWVDGNGVCWWEDFAPDEKLTVRR